MPEIGPMELLVVAMVALIVFGPEKLPDMARKAGNFVADLRRMASEVRTEFDDVRSEFDINDDDDDDSFDPQDEKATPASRVDEADEAPATKTEEASPEAAVETTETTPVAESNPGPSEDTPEEEVEMPIVHKRTRRAEPDEIQP